MSDNKKVTGKVLQGSDQRRAVLKKILVSGGVVTAGSALPERWQKPVMDAVTLPAHAQTSPKENGVVKTIGP